MEYLKRVVEFLNSSGIDARLETERAGAYALLVPENFDTTSLFEAAVRDGLRHHCSYIDHNGVDKHIFQTPETERLMEELRNKTLEIIGRPDLIPMVSSSNQEDYCKFMLTATAAEHAALTMLGVVMAEHASKLGSHSALDPVVWGAMAPKVANEIVVSINSTGLFNLDVNEVLIHLNSYHALWAGTK